MNPNYSRGHPSFLRPIPRPIRDLLQTSLPVALHECLTAYFTQLHGAKPMDNLYKTILACIKKPLIENVLLHTKYNQIRAAHILGINRNTLRKEIKTLGIKPPADNDLM